MQIAHGPYLFTDGGFFWRPSYQVEEIQPGVPVEAHWTVEISGKIHAADAAAMAIATKNLQNNVQSYGRDLVMRHNGAVVESLLNAGSTTGVRLLAMEFPGDTPADFTTYRQVNLTFGASYPVASGLEIIDYEQSLEGRGGEPITIWKRALTGDPKKAITCERTEFHAVQSGYAVGLTRYPLPAEPMFGKPDFYAYRMVTPKREGKTVRGFRQEWTYAFSKAGSAFTGNPGLPP